MTPDEAYGAVLDAIREHAHDDYRIAIPSYRRADQLGRRTLTTIDRLKVDRERVTVFASDEQEADRYDDALAGAWSVVVGRPGLVACRRWYSTEHYPAGMPVLSLDDDIDDLLARTPDSQLEPWTGTVDQLAAMGFGMCRALDTSLWGINGFTNGLYMHDEAVAGLRYICGIAHGCFAGDPAYCPDGSEPDSGEDFMRALRTYTEHGAVVRLDWLGPKTVYFGPGGMCATFTSRDERDRVHASTLRAIALRYPKLVTKTYRKRDGTTNLRLRDVTALRVSRAAMESAAQ